MSQSPMNFEYLRKEGLAGRLRTKLMAIVAEGIRGRVYLSPTDEQEAVANSAQPSWRPETPIPEKALSIRVPLYGMKTHGSLFTPRQLIAMTMFSDLVGEARSRIRDDALSAGLFGDHSLASGGTGAKAYAEAVSVYLGLSVSRTANTLNTLAVWSQSRDQSVNLFSRQAIPMAWDFPEVNPFAGAAGDFGATTASMAKTIPVKSAYHGVANQQAAQQQTLSAHKFVWA